MNTCFLTKTFYALAPLLITIGFGNVDAVVAQSDKTIVANVNDTAITLKEVDNSIVPKLLPLQQQIHALRKAALENLITRTILAKEAKAKGISVEELRKQLTAGVVQAKREHVEDAYAENASAFGSMSEDEAKERLRLDLESQARMRNYREALATLRENSNVEVFLEEPRLTTVRTENAPSIGSNDAPVTIIEFSDFLCTFCKEAKGPVRQVLKTYKNDVRLIFKHLPLEIHPQAFLAAQAAFCAEDQRLFWPYHDALFGLDGLSAEALDKVAIKVGLSLPKFKACLLSDASRSAIRKDVQEARKLGIDSTPTFLINGRILRGVRAFEEFKAVIDRELRFARNTSRTNKP